MAVHGIPPHGKVIGFEPVEEKWNDYILEDGNRLRLKVIVTKTIKPTR